MIRSAASKVMWLGRATSAVVGLAVIRALIFGVASTAFGHGGYAGLFHLGHNNAASTPSTLTKSGAGPALRLRVESGAPLAVNSGAKVANLNADTVDGSDAPLWAVVNANATVVRSKGLTGITRGPFGFYRLTFNRDVSSCGYFATLAYAANGEISAFNQTVDEAQTVRVATRSSNGALNELPFNLVVFC